ncbi:uncharacterized protein METZ01_LOCUS204153, partial [marine metagenome]
MSKISPHTKKMAFGSQAARIGEAAPALPAAP